MTEIVVKLLRRKGNCTLRIPIMEGHEYGYMSNMIAKFADFNRPTWLRQMERGYHSNRIYTSLRGM